MKNMPAIPIQRMGKIFKMVVINCNFPDVKMPSVLTHVNNQIVASPAKAASKAFVANAGINVLIALIKETVIAALVHQTETK